jgi:hypothetical protein
MRDFLRQNPFYLLGATRRDNEARIVELAKERALTLGQEVCQNALSELASLRSRLSAELSWLPDITPDRVFQSADKLGIEFCKKDSGLCPLTRANVIAAWIETAPATVPESEIVRTLLELAQASEEIDPEVVMLHVNRDRLIANIPPVHNIHLVHAELDARRQKFREVSCKLLKTLPTKALVRVLTELAKRSTNEAQKHPPPLIGDIMNDYESAAQGFMEGESYNVRKLAALVHLRIERGEREISDLVETLRKVLRNWSFVMKPILLINRSKGLNHSKSFRLGKQLESLAFELRNQQLPLAALSVDCHLQEFGGTFQLSEKVPKARTKVSENVSTEQQVIIDDAESRYDGATKPNTAEPPQGMKTPGQRQGVVVWPRRSDVKKLTLPLVSIWEARAARDVAADSRSREAAETERAPCEQLRNPRAAGVAQRAPEAEQLTEADAGHRGDEERRTNGSADVERTIREEYQNPEAVERGDPAAQVEFGSRYSGVSKGSYSSLVGIISKDRLEISAAGLAWKGHLHKLEEVIGLRWGFWRHAFHLPIGPRYMIYIRTRSLGTVVRIGDADTYSVVVDRLWSTVGNRILSEYVKRLREKGKIAFPGVLIEDDAVTLARKKMFRINEERLAWDEVIVLSTDRYLTFKMKEDDTNLTSLSYIKTDNLRILEHLIGLMRTRGMSTISGSLRPNGATSYPRRSTTGAPPPILV